MEKKKCALLPFLCLICVALLFIGGPLGAAKAESGKPIKLTYSNFISRGAGNSVGDLAWMDYVTKTTNGRVTFDVFFDGSLAGGKEHANAIKTGLSDLGMIVGAYFPADFPLNGLFMPLYITDKPDVAGKAAEILKKEIPAYQEEYARQNLKLLVGYGIGPAYLAGTTSEPVTSMEQLKGMKVRAAALLGEAVAGLGGVPVSTVGAEIYPALQRGEVKGVILALDNMDEFHLDELVKWVVDPGFGLLHLTTMAINLDTWKRLPPDVQKVMLDAIPVALEAYKAHKMKTDGEIIKKWSAKGIKILALSDEEKERWRTKLLPAYWDNYVAKAQSRNPAAGEFFKRYLELVDELAPTSTYVSPFEK